VTLTGPLIVFTGMRSAFAGWCRPLSVCHSIQSSSGLWRQWWLWRQDHAPHWAWYPLHGAAIVISIISLLLSCWGGIWGNQSVIRRCAKPARRGHKLLRLYLETWKEGSR
jgi:hypothetical protein